ncbi:LytTR family DNA-binding domain-containing protein [Breoghania sp. JC706]|uniref:LytTR family DNA-binding domain-containing protein n=1 Tax=Breoghania sp. JC706 TaxID=3117732 RepID=UPI003009B333
MNDTRAQLALRKWYGLLGSPTFWAIIAAVSIITSVDEISLSAPLTQTLRQILLRLAIATFSSLVASFVIVVVSTFLRARFAVMPRFAIAGLAASPPVFAVVVALLGIARGTLPDRSSVLEILASVTVTVTAIALVVGLFQKREDDQDRATPDTSDAPPSPPQFTRRLPPELGSQLTRLSASDHYVEAYTRRGHAMVLVRFSDALEELAEEDGLQIHRSHWVARDAVRGLVTEGRSLFVEMDDGTRLPISRSRMAAVRAEGFAIR